MEIESMFLRLNDELKSKSMIIISDFNLQNISILILKSSKKKLKCPQLIYKSSNFVKCDANPKASGSISLKLWTCGFQIYRKDELSLYILWFPPLLMKLGIPNTLLFKSRDYIGKHFHRFPLICYHPYVPVNLKPTKNENERTGGIQQKKKQKKTGHLEDLKGSSWACMCWRPQKRKKMRGMMGRPSHLLGDKKRGEGDGQKVHFHSHKRAKGMKKISSSLCLLSRF